MSEATNFPSSTFTHLDVKVISWKVESQAITFWWFVFLFFHCLKKNPKFKRTRFRDILSFFPIGLSRGFLKKIEFCYWINYYFLNKTASFFAPYIITNWIIDLDLRKRKYLWIYKIVKSLGFIYNQINLCKYRVLIRTLKKVPRM